MVIENVQKILNLSKDEIKKILFSIDTVLIDCDGVLWHDNVAIPGSPETVNKLKEIGKRVFFVSNNATKTRYELWQRAQSQGIDINEVDIIAPAYSIAEYLKELNFKQKVYIIGREAIATELSKIGIESFGIGPDNITGKFSDYLKEEVMAQDTKDIGAVIISFDEYFTYGKMLKATNILAKNENCLFLATNADTIHRFPNYSIPCTGALLNSIETCMDKKAIQMGKPNTIICDKLIKNGLIEPKRTIMIGDSYESDVAFGRNSGFYTLLVGSGAHNWDDIVRLSANPIENQTLIPDYYMPTLGDLLQFLVD